MKDILLKHLAGISEYWAKVEPTPPKPGCKPEEPFSVQYRLNGLVHSILAMFDGSSLALPAIDLIASPHEDDEDFNRSNGEDWWPNEIINDVQLAPKWSRYSPDES